MSKKPNPKNQPNVLRHTFAEHQFEPYALALGQFSLAWNDLHERLGMLFITVMGAGWVAPIAAAWSSLATDRGKRKMLEEVVSLDFEKLTIPFPRMMEDIKWLLSRADGLEEDRNNAIHSPLVLLKGGALASFREGKVPIVLPNILLNNNRARKLIQRNDLLAEFRYCREYANVLRDYADAIDHAMTHGGATWPDRPKLPNREEKKAQFPKKPPATQK